MLRSFERVSADEGEDESRIEGVYDYLRGRTRMMMEGKGEWSVNGGD